MHCVLWSGNNFLSEIFNHLQNTKKINCTGNFTAKFIDYHILANTLILKLKYNENVSTILPIDILLKDMNFCQAPGLHVNLNLTCVEANVVTAKRIQIPLLLSRKLKLHSPHFTQTQFCFTSNYRQIWLSS